MILGDRPVALAEEQAVWSLHVHTPTNQQQIEQNPPSPTPRAHPSGWGTHPKGFWCCHLPACSWFHLGMLWGSLVHTVFNSEPAQEGDAPGHKPFKHTSIKMKYFSELHSMTVGVYSLMPVCVPAHLCMCGVCARQRPSVFLSPLLFQQGPSPNLELTNSAGAGRPTSIRSSPVSASPTLELQTNTTAPVFWGGVWGFKLSPYVCAMSSLPSEPSPLAPLLL